MYIDTSSKELMEESVYQLLDINSNHQVFILDDQYDFFMEYVKEHVVRPIDKIMFYHLSRRIDDSGYNLIDVLTKDTSLSRYLKRYGIIFKYDGCIKVYVDDKDVSLDKDDYGYKYLKQRLKYYQDCSIGGYAFGDKLVNSEFYELAVSGPEIFGYLYLFSDQDGDIIDNFINESKYYHYEYLVPIEDIYFTNYDELSNQEKQYHILVKTLQRLYFYKYDSDFNLNDNEVMGIIDNKKISSEYFINKIEI